MIATLNGKPVLAAAAMLPVSGVWTADVEVDAETTAGLTGRSTLVLGALTLVGTPLRLGSFAGRTTVRLVGGAGGLGRTLEPKAYRNATLHLVVEELLTAAGEVLDPASDAAALSVLVPHWSRRRAVAGVALGLLADAAGVSWRVLPGGTVRLANKTWPVATLADGVLLSEAPELGRATFGVERPSLLPGVTLDGRRVSRVEHVVTADAIRTNVWWAE